jgi:non-ribosomal peptide synthetase component F
MFDLTLSIAESEQGLYCHVEYSTDLFEQTFITRLLANFQTLLSGISDNPQVHLSDLPLLSSAEHKQLLVQWNTTEVEYLLICVCISSSSNK